MKFKKILKAMSRNFKKMFSNENIIRSHQQAQLIEERKNEIILKHHLHHQFIF